MKPDVLLDPPWWVADWVPNVDDEPSIARLRRAVWVVFLAGLLAFVVRGADQPEDPFLPSERPPAAETTGGS